MQKWRSSLTFFQAMGLAWILVGAALELATILGIGSMMGMGRTVSFFALWAICIGAVFSVIGAIQRVRRMR